MLVHQLAVFWRDQSERCLTSWHFKPGRGERPHRRAQQILAILQQLSTLQIYGAVLDDALLQIEQAKPAPPHGTNERLQVSINPAVELNPRAGISPLRFTIPGPIPALGPIVAAQQWQSPQWQLLNEHVFPYLCLPNGTGPNPKLEIRSAQIKPSKAPFQPGRPPVDAAIFVTQQEVEEAKLSFKKLQTKHEADRVEREQHNLERLKLWQKLEGDCFDRVELLHIVDIPTAASAPASSNTSTTSAAPTTPASRPAQALAAQPLAIEQPIIVDTFPGESIYMPTTKDAAHSASQHAQQPSPSPVEHAEPSYLPTRPASDQAAVWADVERGLFEQPALWLHRRALQQLYGLEERSYYRWINELEKAGLTRSLPARNNLKVRLYYRPDIDAAFARAQQLLAAPDTGRRGPLPKAFAQHSEQHAESGAQSVTPPQPHPRPDAAPSSTSERAAALAASQQTASSSPALARIEAQLAAITNQLEQLATQQAALAQQLPQAKLLELLAQLVNLNDLPKLLKQLNTNLMAMRTPALPPTPQKIAAPKTSKAHTDEKSLSVKLRKGSKRLKKPGSNVQSPALKITAPAQAAQAQKHKHAPTPAAAHAEDSLHTSTEALSVSQAANLLKKDVATIRRWCDSGKLKAQKINGVWAIDRRALKGT